MSAIESVLHERRQFAPPAAVEKAAAISGMAAYRALAEEAERDYEGFWARGGGAGGSAGGGGASPAPASM